MRLLEVFVCGIGSSGLINDEAALLMVVDFDHAAGSRVGFRGYVFVL